MKYRWMDAIDGKIVLSVNAPGYQPWTDTIRSKPHEFDHRSRVTLDRAFHKFEFDTAAPLISFDKLLAAHFQDGRQIGSYTNKDGRKEALKWEGTIKIGEKVFERRFYEVAKGMGFPTSRDPSVKLFSRTGPERNEIPRFVVGVELIEYDITEFHSPSRVNGAGNDVGRTTLTLEWQVLDRSKGEVVLKRTTTGVARYRHRGSNNLLAFEDALIKFLEQGDFFDLLKESRPFHSNSGLSADSLISTFQMARPSIPTFSNLSELIKYADKACVTVVTEDGHGSGVIINSDGLILSAYHVVDGSARIDVQFSDGLKQKASIRSFDLENDLVLLEIAGSGYRALPLGQSDSLSLGDEVITIGTPADLSLGQSVARGILSGKRMLEENVYLQTDMAVSPGNSGGPLLNAKGEVVGIVQRKVVMSGVEGIGFAIPIERAAEKLHIQVN